MKPRSLFDAEAWVNREFKTPPKPQMPVVSLRPTPPRTPQRAPEPVAPPPPKAPRPIPYGQSYSPAVRKIVETVSRISGVPVHEIKGPSRIAEFVAPRQIVMFLAHRLTDRSMPVIARELGGRDHTTVMHGERRIKDLIRDRQIPEPEDGTIESWAAVLLKEMQAIQDERRARYRYRQARDFKVWRERRKARRQMARQEEAEQ